MAACDRLFRRLGRALWAALDQGVPVPRRSDLDHGDALPAAHLADGAAVIAPWPSAQRRRLAAPNARGQPEGLPPLAGLPEALPIRRKAADHSGRHAEVLARQAGL